MSRILWRLGNGRFRPVPSLEALGYDVAKGPKECNNCGHVWRPVLVSGLCPKCDSANGKMLPEEQRTILPPTAL